VWRDGNDADVVVMPAAGIISVQRQMAGCVFFAFGGSDGEIVSGSSISSSSRAAEPC
jgi:hypothetical protein